MRSVAPDAPYRDRVTGKMIAPLTTGEIYWGAVPFVVLQLVMVVAIIPALPDLVMRKSEVARSRAGAKPAATHR